MTDAVLHPPAGTVGGAPTSHAELRIHGPAIRYVHLPEDADVKALFRARLAQIEKGRRQFSQRIKKKPKPAPAERPAPLVSGNVTEAHGPI